MRYKIINPYGYVCIEDRRRTEREGKPIFHVSPAKDQPLLIYDLERKVTFIIHDRFSDLASVPKVIQIIPGMEAWRWERSAIGHDEATRHGSLVAFLGKVIDYKIQEMVDGKQVYLVKYDNCSIASTTSVVIEMTRFETDEFIAGMIIAEGALMKKKIMSYITMPWYFLGVRIGGWMSYKKKEKIV